MFCHLLCELNHAGVTNFEHHTDQYRQHTRLQPTLYHSFCDLRHANLTVTSRLSTTPTVVHCFVLRFVTSSAYPAGFARLRSRMTLGDLNLGPHDLAYDPWLEMKEAGAGLSAARPTLRWDESSLSDEGAGNVQRAGVSSDCVQGSICFSGGSPPTSHESMGRAVNAQPYKVLKLMVLKSSKPPSLKQTEGKTTDGRATAS